MNSPNLRQCTVENVVDLQDICRRTGDHGDDASATCIHPELLGDYFAVPYAIQDPALCLLLHDDAGPCGYILGTADTRAFITWFNHVWLPVLRAKYAHVAARPDACDAWLLQVLSNDAAAPACVDDYPAHLHIDLLPRVQGRGWGRKLVRHWLDLAATHGASGLHLGVSKKNLRAIAFYERLGLQRLQDDDGSCLFGCRLP